MCFSSPKAPKAPPAPSPAPVPMEPTQGENNSAAEERRKKLLRMRSGLASTIKTSARGITGSGADLTSALLTGSDKLGA